jgi:hypothetical protein
LRRGRLGVIHLVFDVDDPEFTGPRAAPRARSRSPSRTGPETRRQPVAYVLRPQAQPTLLADSNSSIARRASSPPPNTGRAGDRTPQLRPAR